MQNKSHVDALLELVWTRHIEAKAASVGRGWSLKRRCLLADQLLSVQPSVVVGVKIRGRDGSISVAPEGRSEGGSPPPRLGGLGPPEAVQAGLGIPDVLPTYRRWRRVQDLLPSTRTKAAGWALNLDAPAVGGEILRSRTAAGPASPTAVVNCRSLCDRSAKVRIRR
jgi:hypothetical protein